MTSMARQGMPKADDSLVHIKMFSEIHRYLAQRHQDIESLRAIHARKDRLRRDSIVECQRAQEHDSAERIAQIARFSEEMQKYTNRKMEGLYMEVRAAEHAGEHQTMHRQAKKEEMSKKTTVIVNDIAGVRYGLSFVANAMEQLSVHCSEGKGGSEPLP
eukprot:gnl/TRDRNA2_/TRDRNA2_185130_c0_seq1.p1 gnl/TRDRNA2_/TRDRNA2_185130_c0~~gnl/TRDRNA2_/TRDRNA2_185130_c0_seq1.p1  ORF type:complete len:159 (-),score=42.76 gnl/TRDRNA2_/TRDRNA2_185130_c0_seq1:187-663(-)